MTCPELPLIDNGELTYSNGLLVGSVASYTCNDGYAPEGRAARTCLESGRWSDEIPICRRKLWVSFSSWSYIFLHLFMLTLGTCPDLVNPDNGLVIIYPILSVPTFGAVAFYECFPDFILVGNDTRICRSDGTWSDSEPVCEAIVPGEYICLQMWIYSLPPNTHAHASLFSECGIKHFCKTVNK